ncbi:MAG: trimeric intracellular cation channel family protein [Rhizobiales bacterium]|nr:trimeric intracellular cation channel family protein [Hyphomicrobiales bacterium]
MIAIESFVHVLDLGGTFVFAISGAVAAVNRRLDIFGILVLSFVAGNFGGITRDLLIGAAPPAALTDTRYLLVSVLAGLATFFLYAGVDRLRAPVLLFDAVGLSFFAVAGAQKAIAFGLNPVMSALLGMLTGIGGGMMRDVLLVEIPQVLRSDLYAVAALAAATAVVVGHMLDLPYGASAFTGAILCLGLRFMAIRHGWRLPTAKLSARQRADDAAASGKDE